MALGCMRWTPLALSPWHGRPVGIGSNSGNPMTSGSLAIQQLPRLYQSLARLRRAPHGSQSELHSGAVKKGPPLLARCGPLILSRRGACLWGHPRRLSRCWAVSRHCWSGRIHPYQHHTTLVRTPCAEKWWSNRAPCHPCRLLGKRLGRCWASLLGQWGRLERPTSKFQTWCHRLKDLIRAPPRLMPLSALPFRHVPPRQ
jgi:hypothetical protein